MRLDTLLLLLVIAIQIISTTFIIKIIEKHSVHPEFGIYEQKKYHCEPWDSCNKDKLKND